MVETRSLWLRQLALANLDRSVITRGAEAVANRSGPAIVAAGDLERIAHGRQLVDDRPACRVVDTGRVELALRDDEEGSRRVAARGIAGLASAAGGGEGRETDHRNADRSTVTRDEETSHSPVFGSLAARVKSTLRA